MIGERIKELRETHGMTQAALAKKLGLSRSAINAWEMGISIPSTQYLVELALLFKVSTDFLLNIHHGEMVDLTNLSTEEKNLIYTLLDYFGRHRHLMERLQNTPSL